MALVPLERTSQQRAQRALLIGVIAIGLTIAAQLPELLTMPVTHGTMHYPFFGRLAAIAVSVGAIVVGIPASGRAIRQGIAERENRAIVFGSLGLVSALLPMPAMILLLGLVKTLFRVGFYWR